MESLSAKEFVGVVVTAGTNLLGEPQAHLGDVEEIIGPPKLVGNTANGLDKAHKTAQQSLAPEMLEVGRLGLAIEQLARLGHVSFEQIPKQRNASTIKAITST